MPIIARGQQATLTKLLERAAASESAIAEPGQSGRIGVVFVHGIGAQVPGETLLDWSRPIIKILTEWRQRHGYPPDPVVASRIDFTGAEPAVIQLEVPGLTEADDPTEYPPQTWFVTESWWASDVRPPTLVTMVHWLVSDLGRVVSSIQKAANDRRDAEDRGNPPWVHRVDELQSIGVATVVGTLWFAGAALGILYSLVRNLPVVGDKIAIAQLDSFLVDWFGDLRVLLHDQSQAANIRGRVAETLSIMRDQYGCTSIVLVAHSGGVIVSLTTLSDPLFASGRGAFPVTKLLTIGQGMGLAWNLWNAWKVKLPPGDRLAGSPYSQYPDLRWIDFWGTYDPAPAGKFEFPEPEEPPATAPTEATAAAEAKPSGPAFLPTESRPVWNRMSFREDHGGYWDNDEQFVIELVREIDTADGPSRPSRFFRDEEDRAVRVRRRIERVAILGWWRWLVAIGAVLAILVSWLYRTRTDGNRLADIGAFAAKEYAKLPGHEVGSSPLDAAANIAAQIGEVPVIGPFMAFVGQAAIVLVVLLVVAAIPGWYGWWKRRARRVDPDKRLAGWLDQVHWPDWLPPRIAVALGIYAVGAALIAVGSRYSIGAIVDTRSWLADRVHDLWTAQTGNVLLGAVVVVLTFVAIEVLGASRWQAWDERERWEARAGLAVKAPERRTVKLQSVLLLLLLAAAVIVIAFVEIP